MVQTMKARPPAPYHLLVRAGRSAPLQQPQILFILETLRLTERMKAFRVGDQAKQGTQFLLRTQTICTVLVVFSLLLLPSGTSRGRSGPTRSCLTCDCVT